MRNFKKISQPHSFQPSLNIILQTRAEEQLIVTHLTHDHLRWWHLLGKWQGLDRVPLPSAPQRLPRRIHSESLFLFPTWVFPSPSGFGNYEGT